MKRERLDESSTDSGEGEPLALPTSFFTTGCPLLDCVLGEGWAEGRLINIVGDTSAGKTLLAMEAIMGFQKKHPDGTVYFDEIEAAFDDAYMHSLGVNLKGVIRIADTYTVEDMFRQLEKINNGHRTTNAKGDPNSYPESGTPGLYIIDSLDALTSESEQNRDIDAGSYRMEKAKQLSELFRRLNKVLSESGVTVMIVSQCRENISARFGEKRSRSGGKSLDFYSSQILWLSQIGKIKQTIKGIERIVGVKIRAQCKKNKVAPPFRHCDMPITFYYGIDDVLAGIDWLESVGVLDKKKKTQLIKDYRKMSWEEFVTFRRSISDSIRKEWDRIETGFLPKRKKYEH